MEKIISTGCKSRYKSNIKSNWRLDKKFIHVSDSHFIRFCSILSSEILIEITLTDMQKYSEHNVYSHACAWFRLQVNTTLRVSSALTFLHSVYHYLDLIDLHEPTCPKHRKLVV